LKGLSWKENERLTASRFAWDRGGVGKRLLDISGIKEKLEML
jgi:hypothetical protein